ncbi:MAG: hypothetical protein WA921_07745 [Ahrensia sp.]
MKSLFAAAAALALTVGPSAPAHALSCALYDVTDAYKAADKSTDRHVIVVGTLTFDETQLPETDWQRQLDTPPLTKIPAKIVGQALDKSGFTLAYSSALTLEVRCLGPWCARAKSGDSYMAFINIDAATATVQAAPCGAGLFGQPTQAQKSLVQACINNGPCDGASLVINNN